MTFADSSIKCNGMRNNDGIPHFSLGQGKDGFSLMSSDDKIHFEILLSGKSFGFTRSAIEGLVMCRCKLSSSNKPLY